MKIYSKQTEQGNVLFLILIAVALFAALSYAVTQSTRSGGGSAERETSILNSAAMTQYPASLRTSLVRMVLAGTSVSALEFNSPSDFGSLTSDSNGVFHPNGGGAVFQQAQGDLMDNGAQGTWTFNANFNVPQIGLSTESDGNDIIAFLPGVSSSICERVNSEFNISPSGCTTTSGNIPDLDSSATSGDIDNLMDESYNFTDETDTADTSTIQGQGCTAFSGQPSGCFNDVGATPDRFVFYSVLLER
ncbi:MAG: hypothetical protein AAF988_01935 [Pseudomonadota bacterium]